MKHKDKSLYRVWDVYEVIISAYYCLWAYPIMPQKYVLFKSFYRNEMIRWLPTKIPAKSSSLQKQKKLICNEYSINFSSLLIFEFSSRILIVMNQKQKKEKFPRVQVSLLIMQT